MQPSHQNLAKKSVINHLSAEKAEDIYPAFMGLIAISQEGKEIDCSNLKYINKRSLELT
jgi:hypothetical protein